jgi:hypothetical protein
MIVAKYALPRLKVIFEKRFVIIALMARYWTIKLPINIKKIV